MNPLEAAKVMLEPVPEDPESIRGKKLARAHIEAKKALPSEEGEAFELLKGAHANRGAPVRVTERMKSNPAGVPLSGSVFVALPRRK